MLQSGALPKLTLFNINQPFSQCFIFEGKFTKSWDTGGCKWGPVKYMMTDSTMCNTGKPRRPAGLCNWNLLSTQCSRADHCMEIACSCVNGNETSMEGAGKSKVVNFLVFRWLEEVWTFCIAWENGVTSICVQPGSWPLVLLCTPTCYVLTSLKE